METAERLKRWRLILGAESEDRFSKMQGSDWGGLGLSAEELMMDQALAAIYNQTSSGGFGNGPGGRGAGRGPSNPQITRMAGRTPVPERESIRRFAAHQATMVIFLSTGLLEDLQKELTAGGYPPDTPAAIVYKATWPDEKVCRCTVESLKETAESEGIRKTALIIVGRFLKGEYRRSELYNPAFTTEFRKGKQE